MKITAVDGVAVSGPRALHQLPIGSGQRVHRVPFINVGSVPNGSICIV